MATRGKRRFLFLQGPHGPFYAALGARLRAAGAEVWRAGVNAGDRAMWRGPGYLPYRGDPAGWGDWLAGIMAEKRITDLLLYGATRPLHREAIRLARRAGVCVHVLEEGYLRPYWVTYERDGANASSPVAELPLEAMAAALAGAEPSHGEAPDRWGDLRSHMFWGAVYHGCLLTGRWRYPLWRPHRAPGVGAEFMLHLRRLVRQPFRAALNVATGLAIRHGGFPYHVVLMQLAHDANFRDNGPFPSQDAFLDTVFRGFAAGAPRHHRLVLKAHPLEDGREPLRPLVRRLAARHGLGGRVHLVTGGKLAALLDRARSAVTVNSTAAEQALWRGLPLKAFGRAVYAREAFVSDQPLPLFFAAPRSPDREAYLIYRAFLLATSQVAGGFYGFRNRHKLLRQLPDLLLAAESPTERLLNGHEEHAAVPQHIRIVS